MLQNKKNRLLLLTITVVLSLVVLLQSCVKDNFDFNKLAQTEWNPNIAVPLVYSSLTIQDILTNGDQQGYITVGSDNLCTIVYTSNLASVQASDLIVIPDQSYYQNISLNAAEIAVLTGSNTINIQTSQTVGFNPGGSTEIDTMIYKSGTLDISVSSDFQHSCQVIITIPAAKKNGTIFSKTISLNYAGSLPVTSSVSYDLTGYSFDMTDGGTTFNQIVVNYDFTMNNSGNPIATSDQLSITQSFKDNKFDKIFGYIGQLVLSSEKDTIGFSVFNNTSGAGTFTLVDPKVKMLISNSYGVPIKAEFVQFEGYTPDVSSYPITGTPSPLPIHSPGVSQIGQVLTDSFQLNNTNSNIASVINNKPKSIIYQLNSNSNPDGKVGRNFIIDTSRFAMDLEIEMPLYGTAKELTIEDTLDFEFDNADNLESLLIRTHILNGFPFDVGVQIYFTDSLYNVKDSLVTPYQIIMPSAAVNSTTGKVTTPTEKTNDFSFNKARLDNLNDIRKMIIKGIISTSNNGNTNVKIYADYNLDVKIGIQTKLNVKF